MLMDSGNAFLLLQKPSITMSICSLHWVGSLVHLSYLQIVVETIDNEDLHILGNLPTLLYLELCRCHFPVERLVVGNRGFQCLKEFSLQVLNGRMGLVFTPGAMPEVETLRIEFYARETRCNHGVDADFGLEHLSCLTHFIVKIQCWDATAAEVESFDSAIKHAVKTHPNHPMLQIQNFCKLHGMAQENENLQDNRV